MLIKTIKNLLKFLKMNGKKLQKILIFYLNNKKHKKVTKKKITKL